MRRFLAAGLLVAMVAWPVAMGASVIEQGRHHAVWTSAVYLLASVICHQRPERSFSTSGVQWPVCARCSGLYIAAPFGALLALVAGRAAGDGTRTRLLLVLLGLPTLITFLIEAAGIAHVGNLGRALAAGPLGAAIGWLLIRAAHE
jgi:uncharacterized membrane protein